MVVTNAPPALSACEKLEANHPPMKSRDNGRHAGHPILGRDFVPLAAWEWETGHTESVNSYRTPQKPQGFSTPPCYGGPVLRCARFAAVVLAGMVLLSVLAPSAMAMPRLRHVWVVVLENHSTGEILGTARPHS